MYSQSYAFVPITFQQAAEQLRDMHSNLYAGAAAQFAVFKKRGCPQGMFTSKSPQLLSCPGFAQPADILIALLHITERMIN